MAIEHFQIITLDEYKASPLFDMDKENKTYLKENLIAEAITLSSTLIDYLSGNMLQEDIENKKVSDSNLNKIKIACERQTSFLLRNGVEYMRDMSMSISTGSFSMNTSSPQDRMFVCPEVFMSLKKAGYLQEYAYKNFNIGEQNAPCIDNDPINWANGYRANHFLTLTEAEKMFLMRNGSTFTSTDKTIKIKSWVNQTGTLTQVDFSADNDTIGKNILPALIKATFESLVKDKNFSKAEAIVIMNDANNFWNPLISKLELDENWKKVLEANIAKLIESDPQFTQTIVTSSIPLILKDATFTSNLKTQVDTEFDTLSTKLQQDLPNNDVFIQSIADKINQDIADITQMKIDIKDLQDNKQDQLNSQCWTMGENTPQPYISNAFNKWDGTNAVWLETFLPKLQEQVNNKQDKIQLVDNDGKYKNIPVYFSKEFTIGTDANGHSSLVPIDFYSTNLKTTANHGVDAINELKTNLDAKTNYDPKSIHIASDKTVCTIGINNPGTNDYYNYGDITKLDNRITTLEGREMVSYVKSVKVSEGDIVNLNLDDKKTYIISTSDGTSGLVVNKNGSSTDGKDTRYHITGGTIVGSASQDITVEISVFN